MVRAEIVPLDCPVKGDDVMRSTVPESRASRARTSAAGRGRTVRPEGAHGGRGGKSLWGVADPGVVFPLVPISHLGAFLIVDPDIETGEVLAKLCRKLRRARVCHTLTEGAVILDSGTRLTGVIMEEDLPDGTGTGYLKTLRGRHPMLPVLILTANTSAEVINRAHRHRAEFHAKPTSRRDLRGFLRRAVAFERVPEQRVTWLIQNTVDQFALTPRETDLLAAAVAGTSRKEVAEQLGTSENTVKSVVKGALRKMPHKSLDDAAREILHHALEGSSVVRPFDEERRNDTPMRPGPLTIRPPKDES